MRVLNTDGARCQIQNLFDTMLSNQLALNLLDHIIIQQDSTYIFFIPICALSKFDFNTSVSTEFCNFDCLWYQGWYVCKWKNIS